MKALLLLFLLLTSGFCRAQQQQQLMDPLPVDATTRLITYSAVVPTPGVLQATLLARGKAWANHVGLTTKPPVFVNELGTDVMIVAGSQNINPKYDASPQMLYFVARIALREGRYQYHFDEYTLVVPSTTGPSYVTAESVFIGQPIPKASGNSAMTRLRKAFDEATGQAAVLLQTMLTTSLTGGTGSLAEW
ncbi:MAG: hypothetical protein EOO62_22330 [Hymenobacter sp.]|nr:MAG: hypothetical protein EOO62_22330 [Hymenobacter sp.]